MGKWTLMVGAGCSAIVMAFAPGVGAGTEVSTAANTWLPSKAVQLGPAPCCPRGFPVSSISVASGRCSVQANRSPLRVQA